MPFESVDALLAEELTASPEPSGPRPHLLVIDDDETVRKSLGALFGQRYQVLLCATAQEGVAALHEDVCTAIIDIKMKGYDGFWACTELRKRSPALPVIFYSAYQDMKDPYAIINEHRPFGYLTKDGDRERLVQAVDMAVQMYQLTQENKRLVQRLLDKPQP